MWTNNIQKVKQKPNENTQVKSIKITLKEIYSNQTEFYDFNEHFYRLSPKYLNNTFNC